jgi:predicted HicB family RNase H-like nuclease
MAHNYPGTQIRGVRVPDDLWAAAAARAAQQGETVSDVVRRALAEYVDQPA